MGSRFAFRNVFAPAAVLLIQVQALVGQYGSGTILGAITDPSKAVIPGVKVTVRNLATNESRTSQTDAAGNYQFVALPNGRYTLAATAPSFKTSTAPEIVLPVNMQVRVDVLMEIGAVAETISVTSQVPQLQTDNASVGAVIDNRTVLELPLNGRNFLDLVALAPTALRLERRGGVMEDRAVAVGGRANARRIPHWTGSISP